MKRSMLPLPEHKRRPVHWRWVQTRYRAIRRAQGAWQSLDSYRTIMSNNAARQRTFKKVA